MKTSGPAGSKSVPAFENWPRFVGVKEQNKICKSFWQPYIFCQFLLTMSSSIQFVGKNWRFLAKVTLFCNPVGFQVFEEKQKNMILRSPKKCFWPQKTLFETQLLGGLLYTSKTFCSKLRFWRFLGLIMPKNSYFAISIISFAISSKTLAQIKKF